MPVAPKQRRTVGSVLNKLIERVNSNIRRLRILEQESSLYKTRLTSMEEELASQRNREAATIRELSANLVKMESRIAVAETTMKEIVVQLRKTITTTKMKELEELIDIYNPIKSQFITRDEAERMIDRRLHEG